MTHFKFRIIIISIFFIGLISFPSINNTLKLVKDAKNSENRKMASKPIFDLNSVELFPSLYEKFYNDNFSLRSIMVRFYNLINLNFYEKSVISEVIIGKKNWLFMNNENDAYKGKNQLNKSELEAFKKEFEYRKDYLNSRGCKFYVLIAPVKASIYSEYMPSNMFKIVRQSWGEQLTEYLNENSEVKPINVYNVLRKNKNNGLLYYMLDNHWNQLGAFCAANEVLNQLQVDFSELSPMPLKNFNITKAETTDGNIVKMLATNETFKDTVYKLVPKLGFKAIDVPKVGYPIVAGFAYQYEQNKEIKKAKKPKLLVISDSFGINIFPFLAENFSRSVKIFDAWQYKLNEDIVEAEKPNVVLLIVLESKIRLLLKYQSRLKKKNSVE